MHTLRNHRHPIHEIIHSGPALRSRLRPSYFISNGRDGGTGKESSGAMQVVESKAEGIIPTLTSTLHPKPILTIDSSGAPNSIPKFLDPISHGLVAIRSVLKQTTAWTGYCALRQRP